MAELFVQFASEIILIAVIAAAGSVFAYFMNLKKCVKKHKEETNANIAIIDARSLRLSTAFLHFVRRNDELHTQNKDLGKTPTTIELAKEIENLLKDPKTGEL